MSQQPPHDPNQPQASPWGALPQGQPQAPDQAVPPHQSQPQLQPPKKKSWVARHKVLTVVGALVAVFVGGIAGGGGNSNSETATSSPESQADAKPADAPKTGFSQADEFKTFVAKNGTGPERAAANHVTKVQGADSQTDILDAADIYTDYEGGLMGPNQGDAKLLASAFADWKTSQNGLVTVYDKAGELMANGKF